MRTKRFLSIVLTFAMLVGMFPGTSLTTYAEGNTTEITPTNTSGTMNITLTIAAHVHDDISFKAWTATDSMPTEAGNYYLANDMTIGSTWNVPAGTTNLCLNGHGIIMTGTQRVIMVSSGCTLNLYDCGTETVHKFTVNNPSAKGAGLAKVNDSLENGYQSFNGGYVTGGNAGQGGGVYVNGGTFHMAGGNIIGNKATTKGYYEGGGVALSSSVNSRFVMTGGAIQYNTSVGRGGGLGIEKNATVELSGDAKIAYNCSNDNDWAGGISSFGTLNISGNVKITNNKGASALHPQQGSLNISGAPVIFDNEVSVGNILLGIKINVAGTLTEGAKIGVYQGNADVFTDSSDTSYNDASKFVSDNPNYSVMKNTDGQLYMEASHTVTFNANGHGTAPDVQTVASGEKATKPTDLTAEGYVFDGWYKEEALTNEWNFDIDTVTENITLYAKWRQAISYAVTFKVINGKWDDDSIADKTVTLTGYEGDTLKLTADQIPAVGTKPSDTYKAGSWDVMPSVNTAITEATTYTYTYAAKEASVVTKAPEAKTLTYNGSAQELVTAGTATGGTMQYALGTATEATQPYTTSIPTATDAGTCYVWYRVSPDDAHIGTAPACVTVTIAKKTITISGITAANKEFDNTTAATLVYTGIDWAACGMVDGDTLTVTATGSFADANAGTAKTVSITGLTLGGSSVANYVLAASGQQEETTADITLKTMTGIAAANVEVTYDGAEHTITVTGVPAGATVTYGTSTDSITMTQAPVFVDANEAANTVYYKVSCTNYSDFTGSATVKINKKAATITANASGKTYGSGEDPELTATVSGTIGTEVLNYILSREAGENVGGYAITVTPGTNPNYEVTVNDGTFTISKKAATVTAIAAGKIYGSTDPVLSATVEGLVGTDALNYTLSRVAGENVGEYVITVTLGTNPNYEVTANDGTFTIGKKAATVTADAKSKIFGEEDQELSATVSGTVGTDALNYTLSRAAGENAGEYAITVTLGTNPNYDITAVNGTFTIEKATLTTVGAENVIATYDGGEHTITVTGIPAGATVTYGTSVDDITLTQAPTFVNAGETANTVYYKVSGSNYNDFVGSATVRINKRDVTITADDKSSKYGADLQALTYQISSGSIVAGDDLGIELSTTASNTSYVNAYTITVSWNGNTNYNATLENGTYTITRADLTVSASGYNGIYDGAAHGITVDVGTSGEIVYYAETELTEANYNVAGSTVAPTYVNAGTYTVYYYVVPTNYDPQPVKGSMAVNIAQKALTITADSDSKAYDTTALTKDGYTNTVLATGDGMESVTVTGTQTNVGSSANVPSNAVIKNGTTDVTANYDVTYVNGTLTVTQALTNNVTVDITGWTYGDSANAPTSTADFGATTVVYSYSDAADGSFTSTVPTTVGTWYVKTYVAGTENYVQGEAVKSFVIARKALTITARSDTKVYDGSAITKNSYTNTALATGDEITSISITGLQLNVGSSANVPSNAIIKKGTTDVTDNYSITYANGTLTVTKAMTNAVTVNITGWTYGESANAPSSTANFGVDTVVYTYSDAADGTFTATVPVNAGTWYVKASVAETADYAGGFAVTSFAIEPKNLTITADSDTKVYDTTALTKNSFTNTALVAGDGIESVTITGTQTDVGSSNNVPSAAVIKKGDVDVTANYEITYANGTLTVTQALTNTVTVDITGWTYGESANAPTSTAGFAVDTVVYSYSDAQNGTFTATVPTNAGIWYVKASVAGTDNYVEGSAVKSFEIAKKALIITADSDSKVYDTTALTKNSFTNTALASGDSIESVTITGAQTSVGSSANTPSAAVIKKGDTDVTANYAITYANGTLTVTKAMTNTVTVDITGWTYGENANTPSSTANFGADTAIYTYSDAQDGTFTTAVPTTAGTWYVKASVAGTDNYVEGSAVTGFEIAQKALTITADSDERAFTGQTLTKNSYTSEGLVAGDSVESVTVTGSQTNVGNSANIPSAAVIKNGDADVTANYAITYVNGTLTIVKAPVNTVTVSLAGWTYGENANAPSSTANFGADTAIYTYSDAQDGTFTATVPVNAGTWYVKATVAETTDYNGGSAVTSFVIAQKALTITADSDSKVYDTTALTKDSYTSDGLVTGDSIESVTITGAQTNVGNSVNVPSAAVIKKGDTDVTANYAITYTNGTLTVTKALTNNVTVSITGWTYGDGANAPGSTADFGADTVVYTYSDAQDGTFTTAVPTTAGTWYVKAYVAGTKNYVQGEAVKSFVIARKALTITADSDTKAYDTTALTKNGYTNTALATGDAIESVTITGTQTNVGSSANVPSNAVIKNGGTDVTANYDVTYANGTLTVTKAMTNNVTVAITGWTYGDSANAPSSTADFGADTVTYTYSDKADGTFTATAPTHAGLWFVKAYVAGTENFVEGSAITSFNIAKKAVTVTADAKEKTYGDADPALTYVPTGLVGNDTLTGALARAEGENVGTYAITQGTVDSNDYAITYVGADLTVNRREIVISNILAKDKKPDGTTDATMDYSFVVFGNIMAADDGKLSVTAVGTFEDAEIGNDKTVAITGLTLGGEAVGNYVLAASGQQTATTADVSNMAEEDSADGSFRAEVKDFEGFTPQVSGLTIDLAKSLCTPAELAVYNAGGKLELELEIGLAGAAMTDDVVTMVTNAVRDQKNAKLDGAIYLDISLYKVLNGVRTKVTNLNGKYLTITLKVPEDMKNNIWENKRTFYVVQVHSGAANVLSDTIDMTVSFDTDRFSTYALSFADTSIITYGASTGAGTAGGTGAAATVVAPKTYGESVSEKWLVLFGTVSAVIGIVTGVYSFRRKKEEE